MKLNIFNLNQDSTPLCKTDIHSISTNENNNIVLEVDTSNAQNLMELITVLVQFKVPFQTVGSQITIMANDEIIPIKLVLTPLFL